MQKQQVFTAGGKSGGRQAAKEAETAAGINKQPQASKQADSNKQTGRKGAAVAKKASANKKQEADKSLAAHVTQSAAKQAGNAPTVIDLLTPVDLIKKSSANRLKQKQADQAQQQSAAGPAMADAVKTEPAGKKVATRGRNANLQVVEVEPKAKRGKRKAASETAEELGRDEKKSPTPEQLDQDAFLPNRKRSKPSKSAQQTEAAAAVAADVQRPADTQQPSTAGAVLQEVPGLPGVKHQMPTLPVVVQGTKPTRAEAKAAASGGRSQSGAARSNNSRRQASSGKAARAAEASKPEGVSQQQGDAARAAAGNAKVVNKPADRSLDAAMQPTLASAGIAQGMQFQRLQVILLPLSLSAQYSWQHQVCRILMLSGTKCGFNVEVITACLSWPVVSLLDSAAFGDSAYPSRHFALLCVDLEPVHWSMQPWVRLFLNPWLAHEPTFSLLAGGVCTAAAQVCRTEGEEDRRPGHNAAGAHCQAGCPQ